MAERFQPILGGVNTPTYIAPGVVDKSKAMSTEATTGLIGAVGSQAIEAYKGYQVADIEKQHEATIDAFMKGDIAHFKPEAAQNLQDATGELQRASINMEQQWESPSVTLEGITGAEQKLGEAQAKFARAYEQGKISPEEFNTRMLSNLREAINRNPGLEQELVAQTKRVMQYSGMSNILDAMKSQQDSEKKQRDEMMGIYVAAIKDAKVDPANFNYNIVLAGQAAVKQLQQEKEVEYGFKQVDMALKNGQLQRAQVDQIVSSPDFQRSSSTLHGLLHNTIRNKFESGAYVANKPQGMSDVDANILGMQQDVETQRSTIRGLIAAGSEASRPALNSHMDRLQAMEATYLDIMKGKYTAEEKRNRLEIAQATAKMPYVPGMAYSEMLNQFASGFEHLTKATGVLPKVDPQLTNQLHTFYSSQMESVLSGSPSPYGYLDLSTKQGQTVAAVGMALITPDTAVGMGSDQVVATNSKTVKGALKGFDTVKDATQYSQLTDMLVEQINATTSRSNKPVNTVLDVEASQALAGHLERSIGQVARVGKVHYDASLNKFTIIGNDGQTNANATTKFNNLFKALNSIKGFTGEPDIDSYGAAIQGMASKAQGQPTQAPANLVESYSQTPTTDLQRNVTLLEQEIKKVPAAQRPILENELAAINTVLQQRKGQYGTRPDGTAKGKGYFGELKIPGTSAVATEYSVGVNIGGKEMDIPSLVPTLTKQEVDQVLKAASTGTQVPDNVMKKAVEHAKKRLAEGKSPFAQEGEQGVLRDTNYQLVSGRGLAEGIFGDWAKQGTGKANVDWLLSLVDEGVATAKGVDEVIFGPWRRLVEKGITAEAEYRKAARAKLGIKDKK